MQSQSVLCCQSRDASKDLDEVISKALVVCSGLLSCNADLELSQSVSAGGGGPAPRGWRGGGWGPCRGVAWQADELQALVLS